MQLQTERLKLREVLITDLNDVHTLHSLLEIDKYNTLGIPGSIMETETLVSSWIKTQDEVARKKYVFVIENITQNFIGLIGINIGKPNYFNAEIWYKLHPQFWNNGYAIESLKAVLFFCFTELKLHRIEAGCATANASSIKVLEKAGFIREGICRKILPIRGEWIDNYFYAILEEDFYTSDE
jgi:RimJ/RimL family protein N-acetyltransferase